MRFAWSAVFALALAGVACAQDEGEASAPRTPDEEAYQDLLERIRLLEEKQQETELDRLKRQAAKEKQEELEGLPARVSKLEKGQASSGQTWDASKMLSFSTPDGNFTAKVGGRIYLNYRHIFERDDSAGGNVDTFFLDTARIQVDGTFYKDFFYRVELEAQTTSNTQTVDVDEGAGTSNVTVTAARGHAKMKDTYLGWQILPDYLAVQAGQMKTPWSQEETCSSRFVDFGERSLLNRLAPAHDIGVMFRGSFAEKIFEWNLGVFNGAFSRDAGRNTPDPNDEKDVVGRLFISPFRTSGTKFIEQLRIGGDFTIGDRDNNAIGAGVTAGDYEVGTINPFAVPATVNADGLQTRYLFNFNWNYGPASIRAEYGVVNTELNDVPAALEGDFDQVGYYIQGSYVLTGEDKPLENRIKPRSNLNVSEGTWGAFELAARMSFLDTSDGEDAGIVATTANQKTQEIVVGLNWWMTSNVVLRVDWVHLRYDEDRIGIGAGSKDEDSQDILYIRWQIDF
jgi:phosphate-selective porin OprO/OprP